MAQDPDQRLADVVREEQSRLRRFIRRRVRNAQDVLAELVEANHRVMPIDYVAGWLFKVARNRITDLFRRKRPELFDDALVVTGDGEALRMEDLLPSPDDDPEATYARRVMVEQLERALDELPPEQRQVFVAHEIDGRSFKELAAELGVSLNTLLSRKRYAVLHLRQRLQRVFDELRQQRRR